MNEITSSRRRFLLAAGGFVAGLALPSISRKAAADDEKKPSANQQEVNPVEDLMREHGVLRRILLIYDEAIKRIQGPKDLPPGVVADSAGIVRRFVEDYHEKLEEQEVFPRFEKAGKLEDLVIVLFQQHQAGRKLTDTTLRLAAPGALSNDAAKKEFTTTLQQFIDMYRPHAAREDTVLFPAFRSIVSPKEFDSLGDKFEDKENELFGKEGFEKMVDSVAQIEKKLGIYDLSAFTPKV